MGNIKTLLVKWQWLVFIVIFIFVILGLRYISRLANPIELGIVASENCTSEWDKAQRTIKPPNTSFDWESVNETIHDTDSARKLAANNHYSVLAWWTVDDNDQNVMQIEIMMPPRSTAIHELQTVQIAIPNCDTTNAVQILSAIIYYLYTDDFTQNAKTFEQLANGLSNSAVILPPTFKTLSQPPTAAILAFFEANSYLFDKQYQAATDAYNIALTTYHNWSSAHYNLGIAYLNQGYEYLYDDSKTQDDVDNAKFKAIVNFSNASAYSRDPDILGNTYINSGKTRYLLGSLLNEDHSNSFEYTFGVRSCEQATGNGFSNDIRAQGYTCLAAIEVMRCGRLPELFGVSCGSEENLKTATDYLAQAQKLAPQLPDIAYWRGVTKVIQYEYGCKQNPPLYGALKNDIVKDLKTFWDSAHLQTIQLTVDSTALTYASKGFDNVESCP